MRVLFLTRPGSLANPTTIAKVGRASVRHMLSADPEMFVIWVIPKGTSDEALWSYVGGLPDDALQRIKFLPIQAALSERTTGYFLTEQIWYELNQTKTTVPYDVVLNQQPALTMLYSTILWNRYHASRFNVRVPIVNLQQWTATDGQMETNPEYYAGEADLVAETIASSFATNVWEGQWLYEDHLRTAARYVKPSVIRTIQNQSVVLHNGIAMDRLRELPAIEEREPTLFWGGRLADQKQPQTSFGVMQEVQNLMRCRVVVCTQTSLHDAQWVTEKHESFELHTSVGQEEWHAMLGQGTVFVCNSKVEGYGSAWLEMLGAGMIGVFERAPWMKGLIPDWYPYVVDTPREQVEMTLALMQKGDVMGVMPKVMEWLDEEHNDRKQAARLVEVLHRAKAEGVQADIGKAKGTVGQLVVQAAESVLADDPPLPIPEAVIWERMSQFSKANREWGKQGDIMSRMYLRRLLEGNGWRDVCRSESVEFVPPNV